MLEAQKGKLHGMGAKKHKEETLQAQGKRNFILRSILLVNAELAVAFMGPTPEHTCSGVMFVSTSYALSSIDSFLLSSSSLSMPRCCWIWCLRRMRWKRDRFRMGVTCSIIFRDSYPQMKHMAVACPRRDRGFLVLELSRGTVVARSHSCSQD